MSYILEALRKAEQQRQLGDVPGLDAPQTETVVVKRQPPWTWLFIGVLIAALLGILFWPERGQNIAQKPFATQSVNVNQAPVSRVEAVAEPVRPQARVVGRPPVFQQQRPEPALIPIPPAPVAPAATQAAAKQATQTAAASASQHRPGRVSQAAPAKTDELPVWPQVDSTLFSQIGDNLRLDVHVYAEKPAERFVLINLQKYREGDQLQEGPVLETVTPEGVVLSYQGERFRMLAK